MFSFKVMYMYYFLGHKLLTLKKSRKSKQIIAENTFILALDGDVDFQPSAVQLLVDRMKKNLTVGAACGRIHPIGGGKVCSVCILEANQERGFRRLDILF